MKDSTGKKLKKKAGEVIVEQQNKTPDSLDPIEVAQTVTNFDDYTNELNLSINDGKKLFAHDFFIEVSTSKTIWNKVLKNNFKARSSCPTPNYDQTVWNYHRETGNVEYLWTIPDRNACMFLYMNKETIDSSQHELLQFVLDFADGTLFKKCKKLNNEDETESPLLFIKK